MYCIYKSGYALKKEYERSGMKANAVKWETVSADYIDKAICTPTFRECLKRYIELKEKNLLFGEIDEIESRYPLKPSKSFWRINRAILFLILKPFKVEISSQFGVFFFKWFYCIQTQNGCLDFSKHPLHTIYI